jgi:1-deoxy-D-xylulose-5-phosphate synthase
MPILPSIDDPRKLEGLRYAELETLAEEIRAEIVSAVSANGGHLASNLGTVELAIALHRVFDSPEDAIVWDVGHQAYAHKMLTGRSGRFPSVRLKGGLSGFPKRAESPHDVFETGHASTSISSALGMVAAKRALGSKGKAVAVIGDGALTGGLAFEGLSHAGQLGLPIVVVLNDNKMSIGANVGALSRYLSRLSGTAAYQRFRARFDSALARVPGIGPSALRAIVRLKKSAKALLFKENLFSDLGFEYVGPIDGHDIRLLVHVFEEARRLERPVVVHAITRKGKGHVAAEDDPSLYHGVSPGTGADEPERPTFTEAFGEAMRELAREDPSIVAITAAMEKGTGLSPFAAEFPKRLYDVGIAEEHAVTFAGGLAAGGMKPVVAIYSTFMQRAVDQVFHDVVLQSRPVVFALDRAGVVPDDGETHQGAYDVALFRCMPDLSILAPASAAELRLALRWALSSPKPTMIRYAKARCPEERAAFSEPLAPGRGSFAARCGAATAIVATGSLVEQALLAVELHGADADVYNLRWFAPLDEEAIALDLSPYSRLLFLEEGVGRGGACGPLAEALRVRLGVRAAVLALPDKPLPHARRDELLELSGLSSHAVARFLREGFEGGGA